MPNSFWGLAICHGEEQGSRQADTETESYLNLKAAGRKEPQGLWYFEIPKTQNQWQTSSAKATPSPTRPQFLILTNSTNSWCICEAMEVIILTQTTTDEKVINILSDLF